MKTKLNKTFVIVETLTNEKWVSTSGKSSWKQSGHAKTAFYQSERKYFDKQYYYTLVELKCDDSINITKIRGILSLCEEWCADQGNGLTEGQVYMSAMKDIRNLLKER